MAFYQEGDVIYDKAESTTDIVRDALECSDRLFGGQARILFPVRPKDMNRVVLKRIAKYEFISIEVSYIMCENHLLLTVTPGDVDSSFYSDYLHPDIDSWDALRWFAIRELANVLLVLRADELAGPEEEEE